MTRLDHSATTDHAGIPVARDERSLIQGVGGGIVLQDSGPLDITSSTPRTEPAAV